MELDKLYSNRFSEEERRQKLKMWKILCDSFFSRYIGKDDSVLDPAAGYCEFINCIHPDGKGKRIACDLNPDTASFAREGVETHICSAESLGFLEDESVDAIYVSNFFEHIKDKDMIIKMLREFNRVLRKGGKLLLMHPNIRFAYKEYWDFFDHHTPLSDKSMAEAVNIAGGYKIEQIIPRFMPYTTKSRIPKFPFLIKLYLQLPLAWRIMGKQMFIVAKKV